MILSSSTTTIVSRNSINFLFVFAAFKRKAFSSSWIRANKLKRNSEAVTLLFSSASAHQTTLFASKRMYSIGIIGSGNWGSAIAKVVGENVSTMHTKRVYDASIPTDSTANQNDHSLNKHHNLTTMKYHHHILMYVYEETLSDGTKLSDFITSKRENPKYLPGHKLPSSVIVSTDLAEVTRQSDILFIVMPHQFLAAQCHKMKDHVKPNSFAISLCKGFIHDLSDSTQENNVCLISEYIAKTLGVPCHVIMGASIANEVAAGNFCEATVGAKDAKHGQIIKELLQSPYFRVTVSSCAEIVEICGAVKNVVAVAAGFCDGLGYGDNTKAAVVRLGLIEMIRFAKLMFPCEDESVFMESCGVADLIATCYGGRNRRIAEAFVKQKKSMQVLEQEMLNGQKLQGPSTANDMMKLLRKRGNCAEFPIFRAVYEICYEARPVNTLLEAFP